MSIYTHNWYQRNNETYAYGSAISPKSKYTSLLYSASDINKFLGNYGLLSKEFIDLISAKFKEVSKIKLKIEDKPDGDSYTDGRHIVINNSFECADNFDRFDILFGLALHETAHCLYTDFNHALAKNVYKNSLLRHIENILEDEEIENRMSKNYVNYAKFFGKMKFFLLEQMGAGREAIQSKKINNLDWIMTILFCLVRYPKYVSLIPQETLDKYNDLFIKINDILINNNCPAVMPFANCEMYENSFYDKINVTHATTAAAFEIYKYLCEYLQEDFENERKECEENKDSFINKMNEFGIPSGTTESDNPEENEMDMNFRHDDEDSSHESGRGSHNVGLRVISPNITRYNHLLQEIRPYMRYAENIVVSNEKKDILETQTFRRNGQLDPTRLALAMQNVNTVYQQKNLRQIDVPHPRYAFCVIIDESGSMFTGDKRDEFAVKIAILYNEILSKYPDIEFYCYGHGDKINAYINKERRDKYVLGNTDRQGNQDDALAYETIINDVKRQTSLPIVTLNITDAYFCTSDKKLRQVIDEFKHSNVSFNMLQLGHHNLKLHNQTARMLDGMIVEVRDVLNPTCITDCIKELSIMLRKNYDKYNKK